jgi:dihydroneopterin aldolase
MGLPDRIQLLGIECRCRVGVPAAERRARQKILLDVLMEVDAARPAKTDDFRLAVDYWAVEKDVRKTAEAGERALIETLAEQVARRVLDTQPLAAAVTVRVHKTPKVMPKTREVVLELRRQR